MTTTTEKTKSYHFNLFGRVLIGKKVHEFRASGKIKANTKNGNLFLADAQKKFLNKTDKKFKLSTQTITLKKLANKAYFLDINVYKK